MSGGSGFLHKTADGGVMCDLLDAFGYVTRLVGRPGVRDGVNGYFVEASLHSVPVNERIPFIDAHMADRS